MMNRCTLNTLAVVAFNTLLPLATPAAVLAESKTDPRRALASAIAEIDGEARLRQAFNDDKGKVRLLMILSPT